jgi:hypothetical protein
LTPQQSLYQVGVLQRLDQADGTYREASAGGRLDVIRDRDLRDAIRNYYFTATRFGNTVDNRVDAAGEQLRNVLSEVGLSPDGGICDPIMGSTTLRNSVDLRNVVGYRRHFANLTTSYFSRFMEIEDRLLDLLEAAR